MRVHIVDRIGIETRVGQGIESGWSGRAIVLYGASLAVSATALVRCWRRFPEGNLCWNGERWIWQAEPGGSAAENVMHVELFMDLQAAQLLRVQPQGSRKWLWLDRSMDPARWDELRRATAVLPNLPGLKDRHGEAGLP